MRVDVKDGRCRSCDSALDVVDADDSTMTVQCIECDDCYEVEPDAFGDGAMIYYVGVMQEKREGDEL